MSLAFVIPSAASAKKIVRHEPVVDAAPKRIENVTTAKGEPRTTWIVRSNNKTARPAKAVKSVRATKAKGAPRVGRSARGKRRS